MNFNTIFTRWSFNLLSIYFTSSLLILPIVFYTAKFKYGNLTQLGTPLTFIFLFSYTAFQTIALFTSIIFLLKEINPNFRVKKQILLKIFNNIFYQIIAVILGLLEIFLMVICTIGFIQLAPSFL